MTKEQAEEAAQLFDLMAKPLLDVGMTTAAAPYVHAALALRAYWPMREGLEKFKVPSDETLDAIDDDARSGRRPVPGPTLTVQDLRDLNAALALARKEP